MFDENWRKIFVNIIKSKTAQTCTLTSAATGALKARQKIHSRDFYQTALPSQEAACTPTVAREGLGAED